MNNLHESLLEVFIWMRITFLNLPNRMKMHDHNSWGLVNVVKSDYHHIQHFLLPLSDRSVPISGFCRHTAAKVSVSPILLETAHYLCMRVPLGVDEISGLNSSLKIDHLCVYLPTSAWIRRISHSEKLCCGQWHLIECLVGRFVCLGFD